LLWHILLSTLDIFDYCQYMWRPSNLSVWKIYISEILAKGDGKMSEIGCDRIEMTSHSDKLSEMLSFLASTQFLALFISVNKKLSIIWKDCDVWKTIAHLITLIWQSLSSYHHHIIIISLSSSSSIIIITLTLIPSDFKNRYLKIKAISWGSFP